MALPLPAVLAIARDGLFTIYAAADTICRLTRTAIPIVQKKYPTNTGLVDALNNVMAACQVLRLGIQDQKEADKQAAAEAGDASTPPTPTPPPAEPPAP